MRPRARIIWSLGLGAVTTVAVAWGCALQPATGVSNYITLNINEHGGWPYRQLNIQDDRRVGWRLYQLRTLCDYSPGQVDWKLTSEVRPEIEDAMKAFPEVRGESPEATRAMDDAAGSGPANGWPEWPGWVPDIPRTGRGLEVFAARGCGWPLIALRSTAQGADRDVPAEWRGSWRLLTADHYGTTSESEIGAVPLQPMPLAFGVDMAFYAAVWWLILAGPGDVRRWVRRRRCECEYCAYSLRGIPETAPCPECGRLRPASDALLAHHR